MPSPDVLAAYEQVVPGAAERILQAFESVTTKAGERDDRITDASIWVRKTGAGWAFFFLLSLIVGAIVFFALGNLIAGAALLGVPLITVLATIVTTAMSKD